MTDEVLVMVKPSWVDRKQLHSASFRAEKVRQTSKAVCLKLKDGREVWLPWSAIESMEWADRPSMQTQKLDHHGYLNYSLEEASKRMKENDVQ